MFVGAQIVHVYYNPLSDMERYVEEEMKKLKTVKD